MRILGKFSLILLLALLAAGCNLLEIKLESGVVPLPQEQLSLRIMTREFADSFSAGVEQTAGVILQSPDVQIKSNALSWKISAEQGIGQTVFQASPLVSAIDTWAFTAQMAAFFSSGNGQRVFGEATVLAAATSQQLLEDYERRIRGIMSPADFRVNQQFISEYVAANRLADISFARVSAFNDWLEFRNIDPFAAITTFGTMPEVMSDMSDRMAMLAARVPKILGWQAQLLALRSEIDFEDVHELLRQISDASARFKELIEESPEMLAEFTADLGRELGPLLDQLEAGAERSLGQLSAERQALADMITKERLALEQIVDRQRQALASEADALVQRTVSQASDEIMRVIRGLILYIVLFLLVVFFAPLGLGVWLGRRIGTK